ncbi:hypothetical protein NC651_030862 [Populus alba x Populus x berolinensis]|nr:hypothetical protein NC651_030862 [Populus alba x Populus x berolinensis]
MKMENKLEKTKRKLEIGSFSCPQNPDSSLSKGQFPRGVWVPILPKCLSTINNSKSSFSCSKSNFENDSQVQYMLFSATPILRGCILAANRCSSG